MNISNKYARNSTLMAVVVVSVGLHVLALVIFGTYKIVESVMREEQTFEAPEILEAPEEVPVYEVNLEQRNQSSAPPRPNPIVVDSPDVTIPALDIDVNIANSSSYGRGTGGMGTGVSEMREMVIAELDFFGAKATGNNIVMILDATHSGANIFNETRSELFKTLEQMKGTTAQYAVIYFGGRTAGHIVGKMNVDPTKADFWYPRGVPDRKWLEPESKDTERIIEQLEGIDPKSPAAKVKFAKDLKKPEQFFVLGTQYWGAVNDAFRMKPAPDTIFLMVEPEVAFPDLKKTKASLEWFEKHGRRKPSETTIQFIIGGKPKGDTLKGLRYMVNALNGGDLSDAEISGLITTTK